MESECQESAAPMTPFVFPVVDVLAAFRAFIDSCAPLMEPLLDFGKVITGRPKRCQHAKPQVL